MKKTYKIDAPPELFADMKALGYFGLFDIWLSEDQKQVRCPSIPDDFEDGTEVTLWIHREPREGVLRIEWRRA